VRHRLPWLGIVLVIGACDHKPAPKTKPEPAAAAAPAPAPAVTAERPPAPGTPGAPAAPRPAAPAPAPGAAAAAAAEPLSPAEMGKACMEVAVRVANVLAASATDALLKAQYEQARADTVRSVAEACMRNRWDDGVRRCFLAASTQADVDACNARAPGTPAGRPTRGS